MQLPTNWPRTRIPLPAKRSKMQFGKGGCALNLCRILLLQLHSGEAEAIALATDLKADIVLIDEQEGRQLASKAGLAVTGVLGVLLRARRKGDIAAIKAEIDLLRSKARFFVSPLLEAKVLVAAGE